MVISEHNNDVLTKESLIKGRGIEINEYGIRLNNQFLMVHFKGTFEFVGNKIVLSGTKTYYDFEGNITMKEKLKNGKYHGRIIRYNPTTGKLYESIYFSNDVFNGKFNIYFENGKKQIQGTFKDGERTGTWKYYSRDGKLVSKGKYLNGCRFSFTGFIHFTSDSTFIEDFIELDSMKCVKTGVWTELVDGKRKKINY